MERRRTNMRMRLAVSLLVTGLGTMGLGIVAACGPRSPSGSKPRATGPRRPPPKPGESITHTVMCSCKACEPTRCCRELEQEQPELDPNCADGYDFSKCEMAVSSCDTRCFQHRWRTRVEVGCQGSRPDKCCHDVAEM